ncbi:MAG: hypothetical protein JRM82_04935 [Nitrososphaerota archaeon]|nr:hypothetical protein [Nitrososphaerota archaeon]
MLYRQIRYAIEARKLYRLRHLLSRPRHPDIGSLLGFSKYSKQFYRIKNVLKDERILDSEGRFVENTLNLWVTELPLSASREQTNVLGHRIPYDVFLTTAIRSQTTVRGLPAELAIDRHNLSDAVGRLLRAKLLNKDGHQVVAHDKVQNWLLRYIELSKAYADTTSDVSYLFNAIPAYIGGPRAHYAMSYEPGRPIGPSDMVIATYGPFRNLWESLVKEVRYFKEYPRKVEVGLASPSDEIVWVNGIPYGKKARRRRGDRE